MYKDYFKNFYRTHIDELWFTAHSHHPWPDFSEEAHHEYWKFSNKFLDHKWDKIFLEIIPEFQFEIAQVLSIGSPENICIAPNTHEISFRILSSFFPKKIKILTTDSEFHSWNRQVQKLCDVNMAEVKKVSQFPIQNFTQRFITEITPDLDIIYLSHTFFNSGLFIDLKEVYEATKNTPTVVIIDGYHSFMAHPVDLSTYQNKFIFMSGGYKYAGAGEGICFAYIPKSYDWLCPVYTGWFSDFSALENPHPTISYGSNFQRFMGSTFDPSGLFRLTHILKKFRTEKITTQGIHSHVKLLQNYFLGNVSKLWKESLLEPQYQNRGNFLAFEMKDAQELQEILFSNKVHIDRRQNILRIGFGMFHDQHQVDALIKKLR